MAQMDQTLREWLSRHGQRNLFDALSEPECKALIDGLQAKLDQEEALSAEVHTLVEQGHQQLSSPEGRDTTTPPFGVPAISHMMVEEPTTTPATTPDATLPIAQRWPQFLAVACGLLFVFGWSTALYQWGFHKGQQQLLADAPQEVPVAKRELAKQQTATTTPQQRPAQPRIALSREYRLVSPLQLKLPSMLPQRRLPTGLLARKVSSLQLQLSVYNEGHSRRTIASMSRIVERLQTQPRSNWSPDRRTPLSLPPKQLPTPRAFDPDALHLISTHRISAH